MADFDKFVHSFKRRDGDHRAGFVINLKAHGKGTDQLLECSLNSTRFFGSQIFPITGIVFSPGFDSIRDTMLETYDIMVKASGDIPKFEDYIDPYEDESPKLLRPVILENIIDSVKRNVDEVVQDQAKLPADYMKQYDQFLPLINGDAEAEIQEYLTHSHEFEEFSAKVVSLDDLVNSQLARLPKVINLGMYELHCEDIIATLQRKASILKDKVLKKMAEDHQEKNKALCGEFEEVSTTALSSPSNTEELVELKEKVHHIKTIVLKDKESQLNKAAKRLVFLSDYRQFTTSEMKLNSKTFQWHGGSITQNQ